ncbi:glycoside hydrolase family 127 protein [Paenibacillus sp.]|uniref:glycoside hydrolase family 127 protein n=1 Tax=Paenibacillus sp. TaxID=58172 RepID=UPI002D462D6E|nr:beta-L-arabinofuranosidase domain-containing protein [Paenibacillus sp.]HZG56939.1 beta-L-arabinofuranosidase domain-containing protein [Paenibacillus sp.]
MNAKVKAISHEAVTLKDPFWSGKIRTIREKTLPHLWRTFEESGRFRNFERAAGKRDGAYEGLLFDDGLFYTGLEGACWMYKQEPTPELARLIDEAADLIVAMQHEDGYLNSFFTVVAPEHRWSDILFGHELYTCGTFFEAAAAHAEATGSDKLLNAARRLADHIYERFGPGKRPIYPGHEEVELGLLRLYDKTGDARYRELSELFVSRRGQPEAEREMYKGWSSIARAPRALGELLFGEYGRARYMQAHLPVKEQTTIEGHSVRAGYLYAAVAELAALEGNEAYAEAVKRLWDNMVQRRMYVTGGIGDNVHHPATGGPSVEGFSDDYRLPNDQAYCETCASIALVFWGRRMGELFADATYADVVERALYNALLAGISLDGEAFFYTNPLENDGSHRRQRNFECACCPPNVLRFYPKLGEYIYAAAEQDVFVNLFIGSGARATVNGTALELEMRSSYAADGNAALTLRPDAPVAFRLHVRVPSWCDEAEFRVNGEAVRSVHRERGYAVIERTWRAGDRVDVSFSVTVKQLLAHPLVESCRGKTALLRGPFVYCLEEADHGRDVRTLALPRGTPLRAEYRPDLLGGVHAIVGEGKAYAPADAEAREAFWSDRLYGTCEEAPDPEPQTISIVAVPYYAWANRTPGSMTVWIHDTASQAPTK